MYSKIPLAFPADVGSRSNRRDAYDDDARDANYDDRRSGMKFSFLAVHSFDYTMFINELSLLVFERFCGFVRRSVVLVKCCCCIGSNSSAVFVLLYIVL